MSDAPSIPGTLNFRAVRPYRAAAGRLAEGRLYRSGGFEGIGPEGVAALRGLELSTVFDLRSLREKARRPSPLVGLPGFEVLEEPHDLRAGDLTAALADPASRPEDCAKAMRALYAGMPQDFAPVFRRWLRTLIARGGPIAIHCAAGKDRTGVAVALTLDLLGVGRAEILEDYLLTNAAREALHARFMREEAATDRGLARADLAAAVLVAEESYLAAAFDSIEEGWGESRRYAEEALGLSPADLEALERRFLV